MTSQTQQIGKEMAILDHSRMFPMEKTSLDFQDILKFLIPGMNGETYMKTREIFKDESRGKSYVASPNISGTFEDY